MSARKQQSVMVCLAVGAFLVLAPVQATAQDNPAGAAPLAAVALGAGQIQWQLLQPNEGASLTVAGPYGEVEQVDYAAGSPPTISLLDAHGQPRPDGVYTWELRARPMLSPAVRQELVRARDTGDDTVAPRLRRMGLLPLQPLVQSGHFRILNGQLVAGSGQPEPDAEDQASGGLTATATPSGLVARAADVVHADDVIVTGSMCIGFDCLTDGTENFGFDTLKTKENNLRIFFDDTSSTAGFPLNDWRFVANDSASGGGEYFSVEDATNSRTPFKIEANARTSALYVNSSGRVGVGTATPVLNLHVLSGDTPSMRLDQDTSSGWTAQVWDLAGNESNFFVRDVTGGSRLPFRIGPNTPTDTLTLKTGGKVGIGTWSPYYTLDIPSGSMRAGGGVFVGANAGAYTLDFLGETGGDRNIFRSGVSGYSNGFTVRYQNSPQAMIYAFINGNVGIGTATPAYPLHMSSGAHVTAGGVWTNASSRSYKQNIESLSSDEAVTTLANLDPVKFEYKADPSEKHVGFIAEDVPDLVATGDHAGLSPMDVVAVLTKVVQEQQKTISGQQQALEELRARVAILEAGHH